MRTKTMRERDCERGASRMPLRLDSLDDGLRPRDWQPRQVECKVPLRLVRLCLLGVLLPAAFVAGPVYLRYRVFSEQLYPLAISDQRLIDGKISTTWCQRQTVKVNATFNAYLMSGTPKIQSEVTPVRMTRHLVLEDDMKEYWGFYLLRGSSVTVSTCVRWPGASLTVIRGHKHLHECAFIGDDSSEELEELVEVAQERGLLQKFNDTNVSTSGPSNEPAKMKRVHQGIQFHQQQAHTNINHIQQHHQQQHYTSHELDAKDMRAILTQLFMKTLDMKKKQKESPLASPAHHHYEGVFKESANIDKPPTFDDTEFIRQELLSLKARDEEALKSRNKDLQKAGVTEISTKSPEPSSTTVESLLVKMNTTEEPSSMEVFQDTLKKISALGERGKKVLNRLVQEIDHRDPKTEQMVKKVIDEVTEAEAKRSKRDIVLSSPMDSLSDDDEDGDAAIEEGLLHPDGIADDRGTVNETTLNDRSNSEFWSSFSSSEERLLECKGLILNLPLTPHRFCDSKFEHHHSTASVANTITYRVPTDGYYFFVFSSENEIQPNYLRVKFELLRTTYDTSKPVEQCKNSTGECSLPISFFSGERTVLELPVLAGANDSQWNQEYVVISTCEPRTAVYLVCTMAVPLLILGFAFY